jgi:hypothetical protein
MHVMACGDVHAGGAVLTDYGATANMTNCTLTSNNASQSGVYYFVYYFLT